ncbi:MAG: HRDC domain-containing protein, partial [Gammaproteobacteria bacterium]|nr:HRDC domain-containing protein [Gammaproteobacteria bacterium]
RRPLGPELISYAALDVLYLPELYARLCERLEKLGRYAWAVEDSARLVDPALYEVNPNEAWRRLAGVSHLPVPAQRRIRRLARWREEYAMRADRPRQWILGDRSLMDIALRGPRTEAELAACAEVQAGFARRQAEPVLAELAAADRDQDHDAGIVQDARPDLVDPEQVKRLSRVVNDIAKSLTVAPEILATRRDLTGALRGEPGIRPLSGWRRTVVGEPLMAAVKKL